MAPTFVDARGLEALLSQVLSHLEEGRKQIFDFSETIRGQWRDLERELADLKAQVQSQIERVDELERRDYRARLRLMEVSRDIGRHGEEALKEAYQRARDSQVELAVAREHEAGLRRQRDALERRLRELEALVGRAEELVNQVGLAMGYLSGNLQDIVTHVQSLGQRQALGLSIIRAQEEERRRVAREIHDGPAQLLANVALRIDVVQRLVDSDLVATRAELAQLKDLVRLSLQDVRKVIFDLRPMALDDLGLVPALRAYGQELGQRAGLEIDVVAFGEERRLDRSLEAALFRMVQESLTNVERHAQAKSVQVRIDMGASEIRVVVRDDGQGFDVAAVEQSSGGRFGLVGMRERARLIDGRVDVYSTPGGGTRVTIAVPVVESRTESA